METIMRAARKIEREFDEPLRKVVDGFAQMGYSAALTAEALEVTKGSLERFCRDRGIRFPRRPIHHREIHGRPPRPVRVGGRVNTVRGWANEWGISPEGARQRIRCGRSGASMPFSK